MFQKQTSPRHRRSKSRRKLAHALISRPAIGLELLEARLMLTGPTANNFTVYSTASATLNIHGNRVLFLDETEEDALQHVC